ncbi:MAG TPA: hypothetical protein VE650_10440 [Acetobacteraceae bacterium]|nr:hypothetical protein [Acetobacteraceae bacterium]
MERLLSRGYEGAFQAAILTRYDAAASGGETAPEVLATLRPRPRRVVCLARAG